MLFRSVREMQDDVDTTEMLRPDGTRVDIADRAEFNSCDRRRRVPGYPDYTVAALDETAAQRATDEAGRAGHQDAHPASPSAIASPIVQPFGAQMH